MDTFRSETRELTPQVLKFVQESWWEYVLSKVGKGLPETERPGKGKEKETWPQLVARFQDKAWKQECLKRDEKFEMHFSAAVCMGLLPHS